MSIRTKALRILGVGNCVLTCNGTAAMGLTVRALGLTGEVILPSYTFVSTANLLRLAGLTPKFCEISSATMNIDANACAALITPQTSAVIATHAWSKPCDTERLQVICDEAGIALIYDAAHAFGSEHLGRRIGGFGGCEIFSLHATKLFHSFEGGLVATNDGDLAADLRLTRNFGFADIDRVDALGTNAKMSEAHAAIGLANLNIIEATIDASRQCHDRYFNGLAGIPGLRLSRPDVGEVPNWHYVVAALDADTFGLSRDTLIDLLAAENVLARRYFYPGCHRMKPHQQDPLIVLPQTEMVCARVIVLPAGAAIAAQDVQAICAFIQFASENACEIAERVSGVLHLTDASDLCSNQFK